jgi:hypothetical protein
MAVQRSASSELPVKLAAFIQQFVYRPDRGHPSVLLTAHPANGSQQPQFTVDSLAVAHVGNRYESAPSAEVSSHHRC